VNLSTIDLKSVQAGIDTKKNLPLYLVHNLNKN